MSISLIWHYFNIKIILYSWQSSINFNPIPYIYSSYLFLDHSLYLYFNFYLYIFWTLFSVLIMCKILGLIVFSLFGLEFFEILISFTSCIFLCSRIISMVLSLRNGRFLHLSIMRNSWEFIFLRESLINSLLYSILIDIYLIC